MQKIRLEFNSTFGPGASRELLLGFSSYTTDDYDYGYDARNTDTTANDLHLDLNGEDFNIQAYSPITNDKEISLNFKSSGNNAFEIRISELTNIEADREIYLRDNFNGIYYNLRENTGYNFSASQGVFKDRFEIVFQNKQKSLSAENSIATEHVIFYKNATNSLVVKKLRTDVSQVLLLSMKGQAVIEMANVSKARLDSGLQFNNVSTGAYVVRLITNTNEVLTKKIIVN